MHELSENARFVRLGMCALPTKMAYCREYGFPGGGMRSGGR